MTQLPAISLHQPWASLIFATHPGGHQVKVHETRNRGAPPKYVGRRIVIHAALQPIVAQRLTPELQELCLTHFGDDYAETLPRGRFVGTVFLESSLVIGPRAGSAQPANDEDEWCGWWEPGRWAWRFSEPYKLLPTIEAKGFQGWWTAQIPDDAVRGFSPSPR